MTRHEWRSTVAVFVTGLLSVLIGWAGLMAADWLVGLLPEFMRPGVAAIGGVLFMVAAAVGWWRLYLWIEARL